MKTIAAIPAYNEEATIGSVVLRARKYVDQVIVVDDGSTDDTSLIAGLAGAEVVKHEKNKGYGAAIKSCFNAAKKAGSDVMVVMDADWQHNPGEIQMVMEPVKNGEADIVIGSRFINETYIPAYRKFGMNVLNVLTRLSSGNVSDTQSGFRAYSSKAIKSLNLKENGMGVGSEILMKAKENDLKIKEVPITVKYDTAKPSQHQVSHGLSVIVSIIKVISETHPPLFFGITGTSLLLIGLFVGYFVIMRYNENNALAVGMALITVLLIISGLFLMLTGVILYTIQDVIRRREKE